MPLLQRNAFHALAFFALTTASQAQTWDGSSGFWSAGAHWNPHTVPNSVSAVVVSAGTITLDLNAQAGSLTLSGGTITGSGNLTINGSFNGTGGEISGTGTITLKGASSLTYTHDQPGLERQVENYGAVTFTGTNLSLSRSATTQIWNNHSGASFTTHDFVAGNTIFNNLAGATFVTSSDSTDAGNDLRFNNSGTVSATHGVLTFYSAFTQSSTGELSLTNASVVVFRDIDSFEGTISGIGEIVASQINHSIGKISPGTSQNAGTLTFNSALALAESSHLAFDLGTTADRIVISSAFTANGLLDVQAGAGFGAGTYTLLEYGSLIDNGITLGTMPAGYQYELQNDAGSQRINLVVTAVPEPEIFALLSLGMFIWLIRRPARN